MNPLQIGLAIFFVFFLLVLPRTAVAMTIASQTQSFSDQLTVPGFIQELGNNLSGVAKSFTFRVSTSKPNNAQFDGLGAAIYDKDNNNYRVFSCPDKSNPMGNIVINTTNVPTGYEDVTLDFSCNNYSFIPGHRYLIWITNAYFNSYGGWMILAAAAYGSGSTSGTTDLFTGGGLRYFNGNKFDFYHGSGMCSGLNYIWNDPTLAPVSGCNIWTTPKDDLFFILTNNAPQPTPTPTPAPAKTPVIFIPGIGGSEMKATNDIIWSFDNGHGGNYSHAYTKDEKVWVNQDEAVKLGDDDYFDVLKLKPDGQTPEAPGLVLSGTLTSFGYGDVDPFFQDLGYEKDKNFFIFPYDWRKDVRSVKDDLDSLIEKAKQKSGKDKVDLVVHSMGGLVARYYISDPPKAAKVNKLIELGVPHLGAPYSLKTLVHGTAISYSFKFFEFPIIAGSEVKDVFQNLPSAFQISPSKSYFTFYDNSSNNQPYPLKDDRDIDVNKITGSLNYDQTKTLLSNLKHNMSVFDIAEQFHSSFDPLLNQSNNVKIYTIVGSGQPTLGQIHETWWVTWPVNLIPKTDQIFINGDDTVPLYSASLKSDSLDLSGGAVIYYVEQKHSDLVSKQGSAMRTVKSILNTDNSSTTTQQIPLEGTHVSLDGDADLDLYDENGNHTGLNSNNEVETNIPNTFYDSTGSSKHIFIKKSAKKVKVKAKSAKPNKPVKTKIKLRNYSKNKTNKTTLYNNVDIPLDKTLEFTVDPEITTAPTLTIGTQIITASSETSGNVLDQTPPVTTLQTSQTKDPVTVTLTGSDDDSGILKIEYSLDNGVTVQTYTQPFTISTPGTSKIQVKSTDKSGNEEIPQTITIEIASISSPTPTPSSTSNASSDSSSSSSSNSSGNSTSPSESTAPTIAPSASSEPFPETPEEKESNELSSKTTSKENISDVLGVDSDNVSQDKNEKISEKKEQAENHKLTELLLVSGGIITVASIGLFTSFIKPPPK